MTHNVLTTNIYHWIWTYRGFQDYEDGIVLVTITLWWCYVLWLLWPAENWALCWLLNVPHPDYCAHDETEQVLFYTLRDKFPWLWNNDFNKHLLSYTKWMTVLFFPLDYLKICHLNIEYILIFLWKKYLCHTLNYFPPKAALRV